MTIRDLELGLQSDFSKKQNVPGRYRAVITDASGNTTGTGSIWRNESLREVWLKAWGSGSPSWVYCYLIEPIIGLGVWVEYTDYMERWEVTRDDPTQRTSGANRRSYNVVSDQDFITGGRFQHWLEAERFQPLAVYPGSGLSVSVVSGYYVLNGLRAKYGGIENFSISSLQPAGPNEHCLVGLYIDSGNALQSIAGATVATATTAPEPIWPAANITQIAVVDLDDSQTTLDLSADIDNRRAFLTIGAGGGSWPADGKIRNGTIDYDFSDFQTAIDNAGAGDIIKLGAGRIAVSITIDIDNINGITIVTAGLGSTTVTSSTVDKTLNITEDCFINDLIIENTYDTGTTYAVYVDRGVEGTDGNNFDRCRFINTGAATDNYAFYTNGTWSFGILSHCEGDASGATNNFALYCNGSAGWTDLLGDWDGSSDASSTDIESPLTGLLLCVGSVSRRAKYVDNGSGGDTLNGYLFDSNTLRLVILASNIDLADNKYIGLGSGAGRIAFDDLATDEINILDANIKVEDDSWIGLSSSAGRLVFEADSPHEINIQDANLGINTSGPVGLLHVQGTTLNSAPASVVLSGVEEDQAFTYTEVFKIAVTAQTEITRATGSGQNGFAGFVKITVTGHTAANGNGGLVDEYSFSGTTVTQVSTTDIWGTNAPTLTLALASDVLTISLTSADGTNTFNGVMKVEYFIPPDFSANTWVVS